MDYDDQALAVFRESFGCSPTVASAAAALARRRSFGAKAVVVPAGTPPGEMLLILSGLAQVLLYALDGRTVRLEDLRTGDLFGALDESGMLAESEVIALTGLTAAIFRLVDFLRLADMHGCIGMALARALMRRLQWTAHRIVERSTLSATGRTYAEILRLSALSEDGRTIAPPPVVVALAQRVQTTRETASRALAVAERRGIIRRDDRALTIVSLRLLEDLIM